MGEYQVGRKIDDKTAADIVAFLKTLDNPTNLNAPPSNTLSGRMPQALKQPDEPPKSVIGLFFSSARKN